MDNLRFGAGIWLFGQMVDRYATDAYGPPVSTLEAIDRAGQVGELEALDINYPFTDAAISVRDVKAALERNHLRAVAITPHLYMREFRMGSFTHPDPAVRRRAIDLGKRAIEVAHELDAAYVKFWQVMQRVGFSIADAWTKAGFKVNARQVDNGEFNKVQDTNALLTTMVNWSTSCVFNTNYLNSWRSFQKENLKDPESNDAITGNRDRITDPKVFDLITRASSLDQLTPEFVDTGRQIIQEMIRNMEYINMMNIPTTIPTNSTYWTNFPKADNPYAVPYTWWSSFKKILVNIKPAAQ